MEIKYYVKRARHGEDDKNRRWIMQKTQQLSVLLNVKIWVFSRKKKSKQQLTVQQLMKWTRK